MDIFLDLLSIFVKICIGYSTLISLFFLLPRKRLPKAEPKTRFAVVLAARNEEAVIASTVKTLLQQRYPRELYDVYVVPNNCTDDTEGAARRAGAEILPCLAPCRNKGDALRQAFAALDHQDYDAYCVFDADNLVDPDFLARMNDAFCAGYQVAKGVQRAMNPNSGWVAGCYDLYFEHSNLMFNRPRMTLKLSSKLVGTGFAVSKSLLREMGGWNTHTMAEDAEFAAQCAMAGQRVCWVPEALSYDEEPTTFWQSMVQRRRWCSGVMQVARCYVPKLFAAGIKNRRFLPIDFALFLLMPLVQVLALLPGIRVIWNTLAAGNYLALVLSAASFWVSMMGTALAFTIVGKRPLKQMLPSILLYPLFTASWYPLHILALFCRVKVWKPIAHGNAKRELAEKPQGSFSAL